MYVDLITSVTYVDLITSVTDKSFFDYGVAIKNENFLTNKNCGNIIHKHTHVI